MTCDITATTKNDKLSTSLEDEELIITVENEKISSDVSPTEITTTVEDTKITSEINGGVVLNPDDYLAIDGSNADQEIDIASYDFTTTGIGAFGKIEIDDANSSIDTNGSNNMIFTDAVTGTKTLAQLATAGSTGDFIFASGDVDLYISTAGDDTTGDGSIGSPWATPEKLIEQMALYRTDGTITGNIANGTYTNPTPSSDWITVPQYAAGTWVISGDVSTPTNVILDGDDANPSTGKSIFIKTNDAIVCRVEGINFKNAYISINTTSTLELKSLQFDNYRFAVNMADQAEVRSYGGGSFTLTFNGSAVTISTGFRMLTGSRVTITENIRMNGNRYDFSASNGCYINIDESVSSDYQSTLGAATGTSAIILSRNSAMDIAMDMTLDGNSHGSTAIAITNGCRIYSFGGFDHALSGFSSTGINVGTNCFFEEPLSANWTYGAIPNPVRAEYSAIITAIDSLDTTIAWYAQTMQRGYDEFYPSLSTGTSAPSSTPTKVGDTYTDTSGGKVYISTGTTNSADWKILN